MRNRSYTLRLRYCQKNYSDPTATSTHVETDVPVAGDRYLVETALVEEANRTPINSVYYDGETLHSHQADTLPTDSCRHSTARERRTGYAGR